MEFGVDPEDAGLELLGGRVALEDEQGGGGDAFGDGRDGGGAGADVRTEQQQETQERGNDDLVQEDDACGGEQGGEGEQAWELLPADHLPTPQGPQPR